MVGDSELIAKQVKGVYKVKHPAMQPLHRAAMAALRGLRAAGRSGRCPRAQNARADALVNAALGPAPARAATPPRAQCSGCAERAIASIWAFESSSSSVLVTQ